MPVFLFADQPLAQKLPVKGTLGGAVGDDVVDLFEAKGGEEKVFIELGAVAQQDALAGVAVKGPLDSHVFVAELRGALLGGKPAQEKKKMSACMREIFSSVMLPVNSS